MSHPSLYDTRRNPTDEPSRTVAYATRLNGLCELRQQGTLTPEEFQTLLRDLGVPSEPAFYLELAIAGGLKPTNQAEIAHEYVPCPECRCTDGEHFSNCMGVE